MTSRERLTRIFQGKVPDRPAVRLWGAVPLEIYKEKLIHPAYEPVYRAAMELSDLVTSAGSPFNLSWGSAVKMLPRSPRIQRNGWML